jgi:predicted lipid-binding transport protein (Tim44 family)
MLFDIIIFAVIAAFVFVKFKSVLGNEYDKDVTQERKIKEIKIINALNELVEDAKNKSSSNDIEYIEQDAILQMDKLAKIIDKIDAKHFIEISKKVFEMMLNGYTHQNDKIISQLASKEISDRLVASIKKSKEEKIKIINILIAIDKAIIKKIDINDKSASIYVAFDSQQINYSEDENAKVINGDKGTVNKIAELWQFKKNFSDDNKQWLLVNIENC